MNSGVVGTGGRETNALQTALKRRLAEVEQERQRVSDELARLETEAAGLSDESVHLRALIERHAWRPDLAVNSPELSVTYSLETTTSAEVEPLPMPAPPTGTVPSEPSGNRWLMVATEVLERAGGPLHYRELHKRMKALGAPAFGGQNPVATFLAAISREAARPDSRLTRVGRGEYAMAGQREGGQPATKRRRARRGAGSVT